MNIKSTGRLKKHETVRFTSEYDTLDFEHSMSEIYKTNSSDIPHLNLPKYSFYKAHSYNLVHLKNSLLIKNASCFLLSIFRVNFFEVKLLFGI